MGNQVETGSPVPLLAGLDGPELLNLLPDGAYITDRARRILFWNKAAERLTGWSAQDVVGRACHENILVHVDKDGHALCGHEHCPLHRSIVTEQPSETPVLVFAQHKGGFRTPVEVMVSPVRDRTGTVVGGIEIFRDLTDYMRDQLRAKRIQAAAVNCTLPPDDRVEVETWYQPRDVVGGDFYRIERFDEHRYAVLVADAMGHGVSAALNTIQLRSLWNDHRAELPSPARFIEMLNDRLHALVQGEGYFGTAVYATYDAASGELTCVRAGHPSPLLFRSDGGIEAVGSRNPPLGMLAGSRYQETAVQLGLRDTLLLFTDGATEIRGRSEGTLGPEGLRQLAKAQTGGEDPAGFRLEPLEQQLLQFSNQIHLPDDLTLLRLRRMR
jgi:sigma-B regulation protein RsbU (phosphoserine phosphatase)